MSRVEFRHVSVEIQGRAVLNDISFAVEPGEALVLLGRSGSGKTSSLRLINGMLRPTRGEVLVDARATTEWDPVRLRRSTGYVIQEGGLFPHFTVARNVSLVPQLEAWPADRINARTADLLTRVGLPPEDFAHRLPHELSGGQRQRVGVARALAAQPSLLLFDEPFGALDPVTRLELQDEFLRLRADLGTTSVFVTHDVREAAKLASRIVLLHEGNAVFIGTTHEFRRCTHPEARAFLSVLDETPA